MFFSSLEQTLTTITNKPGWEKYQQHRQLLECWQKIVSKEIAQQTRLLYVNRKILWVATSSSVWAQELTLKRYSILKQLNAKLEFSLKDIRFSVNQWQQTSDRDLLAQNSRNNSSKHPSILNREDASITADHISGIDNPQAAFQHWLNVIQKRSSNLPLCPQCQSPTPEGELKRWFLCCHCAAKKWSDKHQSVTSNHSNQNNFKNK
ncbi:MAG: DciA family protein [Xenococcaceae cyanobacterium MO_188.B29]|nr:DciA family protein [Xenococcaceae cyanobacterium MO_188.B29]